MERLMHTPAITVARWSYDRPTPERIGLESVKTSSDPGDSNESFEVSCAHRWRRFGGKPGFHVAEKNEFLPFEKP